MAGTPNRFLAALQIGVTLAGFLSAAFGAATLSNEFAPVLVRWGVPHGMSDATALIAELQTHLESFYPPESRHGFSVQKLIDQQIAIARRAHDRGREVGRRAPSPPR